MSGILNEQNQEIENLGCQWNSDAVHAEHTFLYIKPEPAELKHWGMFYSPAPAKFCKGLLLETLPFPLKPNQLANKVSRLNFPGPKISTSKEANRNVYGDAGRLLGISKDKERRA